MNLLICRLSKTLMLKKKESEYKKGKRLVNYEYSKRLNINYTIIERGSKK